MKQNIKKLSMAVATLLALNLNANAGAPGSGKYLAIGAIVTGATIVGATGFAIGKNIDEIKAKERESCVRKVATGSLGSNVCCVSFPSLCKPTPQPLPIPVPNPEPLPIPVPNPEPSPLPIPIPVPNPEPLPIPTPGPIGTGVSEPVGFLAGLTALSLFFVARRRK